MQSAESPWRRSSTIIECMTSPPLPTARSPRPSTLFLAFALAASAWLPRPAAAQAGYETYAHRHALGTKVGTTGLGIEYSYAYSAFPRYGLRTSLNFGSYERSTTRSGILFDASAKFNSLALLADAHPYENGFRVSAGLLVNFNKVVADGRPTGDTVTINDVTYPSSAVERAEGEVTFQWPSPYFGVGWGAAPTGTPGVFFSLDFGVAYQRGDVTLNVTCGPTLPAAECARLQSDVLAQQGKFQDDLTGYRLYPILNLGVGYKF
jgi:hypothetical protein